MIWLRKKKLLEQEQLSKEHYRDLEWKSHNPESNKEQTKLGTFLNEFHVLQNPNKQLKDAPQRGFNI